MRSNHGSRSKKRRLLWACLTLCSSILITVSSTLGTHSLTEAASTFSFFGADVRAADVDRLGGTSSCPGNSITCVEASNISWVRCCDLEWSKAEPISPTITGTHAYMDDIILQVKDKVRKVSKPNTKIVVLVASTPSWARKSRLDEDYCQPPTPERYDDFADFIVHADNLFKDPTRKLAGTPQFNRTVYWQIANEPDVIPVSSSAGMCWGESSDTYYGGRAYGTMLTEIYSRLQLRGQVVVGGFLLAESETVSNRGGFLRGLLIGGGYKPQFDYMDFHSYADWDYPNETPNTFNKDWSFRPTSWNTVSTGRGLLMDQLRAVRTVLNDPLFNNSANPPEFRAATKPILVGEVGLVCRSGHCGSTLGQGAGYLYPAFTSDQPNWVIRAYIRAASTTQLGNQTNVGAVGIEWYSLGDGLYGQSGLADYSLGAYTVLRPGYYALKFFANKLGGATFVTDLTCSVFTNDQPVYPAGSQTNMCSVSLGTSTFSSPAGTQYVGYNYEGYRFCKNNTRYDVYWSNIKSLSKSIPVPAGSTAYELAVTGSDVIAVIPITNNMLQVKFQPRLVSTPNAC